MLGQRVNVPSEGLENRIVYGRAQMADGRLLVAVGTATADPAVGCPPMDQLRWVEQSAVVREHGDGSSYGSPAGSEAKDQSAG